MDEYSLALTGLTGDLPLGSLSKNSGREDGCDDGSGKDGFCHLKAIVLTRNER